MRNTFLILFTLLCLPLFAQEENNPQDVAKRLQVEIAASRQKAETVRQATETAWQRHTERMEALQKESDEFVRQLEQLTDDIAQLQQENQEIAIQNAAAQAAEQRLVQLLPQNDDTPLPIRLEHYIKKQDASFSQFFQPPQNIPLNVKDATGRQLSGTAIHIGPLSLFFNQDGGGQLFNNGDGGLPTFHPLKPSSSQDTYFLDITGHHPELFTQPSGLLKHLRQGGVLMIPILLLGIICLMVMVYKLIQLAVHRLSQDLQAVEETAKASTAKGEALEDELFTVAQQCIARREHLLFWLSVSASAAPLLGLLGTVTGMIHTFRLITVFGVGDARLLADGISEALITTEAGLCVAIPALLCHAWLARLARQHATALESKIANLTS